MYFWKDCETTFNRWLVYSHHLFFITETERVHPSVARPPSVCALNVNSSTRYNSIHDDDDWEHPPPPHRPFQRLHTLADPAQVCPGLFKPSPSNFLLFNSHSNHLALKSSTLKKPANIATICELTSFLFPRFPGAATCAPCPPVPTSRFLSSSNFELQNSVEVGWQGAQVSAPG